METKPRSGLLRRWYFWAMLTVLVVATAVSGAIYTLPGLAPGYTSVGLLQIKPALEPILYETAFNSRLADYDQFLESQVPILKSQRIILQAMALKKDQLAKMDGADLDQSQRLKAWDDKTWADVAPIWGPMEDTKQIERLTEGLEVTRPRGTQVLQISFHDRDATLAPVVVKLVIAAYKKIYDVDVDNYSTRMKILDEKERGLTTTVNSMKESVKVEVGDFGSEEFLLRTLDQKQTELLETDQLIGKVESQLKAMAVSTLRRAQNLFTTGQVNEADAVLRQVEDVWSDLGPRNNNAPAELRKKIDEKLGAGAGQNQIQDRVFPNTIDAQNSPVAGSGTLAWTYYIYLDSGPASTAPNSTAPNTRAPSSTEPGAANTRLSLTEANDMLSAMRYQYMKLGDDIKKLREQATSVQTLAAKLQTTQQELDTLQSTKHKLEFEGIGGGRTEVISPGDKPVHPNPDRRPRLAAESSSATAGLGLIIIALIALIKWLRARRLAPAP